MKNENIVNQECNIWKMKILLIKSVTYEKWKNC